MNNLTVYYGIFCEMREKQVVPVDKEINFKEECDVAREICINLEHLFSDIVRKMKVQLYSRRRWENKGGSLYKEGRRTKR